MGKSIDMACAEYPVMDHMNLEGWVLQVRSNFRYSEEQKNIFYGLFIKGQKSEKVTPEEANAETRKKLL